jgi:hypothetical protein
MRELSGSRHGGRSVRETLAAWIVVALVLVFSIGVIEAKNAIFAEDLRLGVPERHHVLVPSSADEDEAVEWQRATTPDEGAPLG